MAQLDDFRDIYRISDRVCAGFGEFEARRYRVGGWHALATSRFRHRSGWGVAHLASFDGRGTHSSDDQFSAFGKPESCKKHRAFSHVVNA
jgi:hypothetical protein